MKQSLQLNLQHQLTLTPQLQQAIRLLQLSTLDLQLEIQQKVEANPLLDCAQNEEIEEHQSDASSESNDEMTDCQWSHLYSSSNSTSQFNESDYIHETLHCTTTNLHDHLHWQLELTPMSDIDRVIATAIIDAIDDNGFLTLTCNDLHVSLNSSSYPLDIEEIEAVKHRIQQFDPVGCGANSLTETLLVQLGHLSLSEEQLLLVKKMITDDLELLAQHNYRQLTKQYKINENQLEQALAAIQLLNPKPGAVISHTNAEYVIPDLTMVKKNNRWCVILNQQTLPRVSINNSYASLINRVKDSSDNQFLKSHLQDARWFLKSLQSRHETLLNVARFIVDYQQDYFLLGDEAMKPLILNDVAHALDMHESTISRVTTQKFIHTPRGLFELKYFFSSHVASSSGGECSSTAIRAVIKKLITSENPQKPLSDNKLTKLIAAMGITIARRTVAKYREMMNIAPSNERKLI